MNRRTRKEKMADAVDCDLDRIARRAYDDRDEDERWRQVAMKIEAARGIVRQMMHQDDRAASDGAAPYSPQQGAE